MPAAPSSSSAAPSFSGSLPNGRTAVEVAVIVTPDFQICESAPKRDLAHRCPLCWHPLPRVKAKGADPNRASRGVAYPSEIKSVCWATSPRIRGRRPPESAGSETLSDLGLWGARESFGFLLGARRRWGRGQLRQRREAGRACLRCASLRTPSRIAAALASIPSPPPRNELRRPRSLAAPCSGGR